MANDDEDREAILARRKRLIAIAIAGTALIGCGDDDGPTACLSMAATPDADTGPSDQDAASDAGTDADDVGPMACLSPLPPDASDDGGEADAEA